MEITTALAFIEKNNININEYKTVIVTSDNAVYLDSDIAPIAEHCKEFNKTFCVVKGENETALETVLKEEIKSETPKKVKAKK